MKVNNLNDSANKNLTAIYCLDLPILFFGYTISAPIKVLGS
jgi:hypothetical protein